ncbi:MAG: hypothetical protein ABIH11_04740 [Candidatus Altiarchaeota archaeon]
MRLESDYRSRVGGQGFLGRIADDVSSDTYRPVPSKSSYSQQHLSGGDGSTHVFRAKKPSVNDGDSRQAKLVDDCNIFGMLNSSSPTGSGSPQKSSGKSYSCNGKGNYFTRLLDEVDCGDKPKKSYEVKDKDKCSDLQSRVKWLETAFKEEDSGSNVSCLRTPAGDGDCMDIIMSMFYRIKALRRYGMPQQASSELELMTEDLNQLMGLMKKLE